MADPNFIMREANSPPQWIKISGSNKRTSAEKKKNNKLTPKETSTPTRRLWCRFGMMEKLAIEEGAPVNSTPTSIHNLIKSDFLDKEVKEFLKSLPFYPHVGQSCVSLCCPDGIACQHFNKTQLPFEI